MKVQQGALGGGKARGIIPRAREKFGKAERSATRQHVDAGAQPPEHLLVRRRGQKDHSGKQERSHQHPAVVERRGKNAQQDQKEDAAREQPVASKAVSEAGLNTAIDADVDKRNKQQVAERQRMSVKRI